jgi:hypothetical protein
MSDFSEAKSDVKSAIDRNQGATILAFSIMLLFKGRVAFFEY